MNRSFFVAGLMLAGLLLPTGCGEATTAPRDEAPDALAGAWELEGGTGVDGEIEPLDGHRITLALEGDRVSGSSGCNSYGGSARVEGDRIEIAGLGSTEMACEPDAMAVEAAFVEALLRVRRVETARRDGGGLVLSGPSTELTFARIAPVPARALVGTTWELDTVIRGDTAATPVGEPTLRLGPGGGIEGTTGCRAYTGSYTLRGDEVVVTRLSLLDDPLAGRCAPAGEEQEALVAEVLGDRFQAEVEGDRLTLTSRGGNGLVYRAR